MVDTPKKDPAAAPTNRLTLALQDYPWNLLLGTTEYPIGITFTSLSPSTERFKVAFEGDGVTVTPSVDFSEYMEFPAHGQLPVDVAIKPTRDGSVRLTLTGYREKKVEYTIKERRVQPAAPETPEPPGIECEEWEVEVPESLPDDIPPFPDPEPPTSDLAALEEEFEALQTQVKAQTAAQAQTQAPQAPETASLDSPMADSAEPDTTAAPDSLAPAGDTRGPQAEDSPSLVKQLSPEEIDARYAALTLKFAKHDVDRVRAVANEIQAPAVRQETLVKALHEAFHRQPEKTLEVLREDVPAPALEEHLKGFSGELLARSLTQALGALDTLSDAAERDRLVAEYCTRYLGRDPRAACDELARIQDAGLREAKRAEFATKLGQVDLDLARAVLDQVSDGALQARAREDLVKGLAARDLATAATLAQGMTDEARREHLLAELAKRALASDPASAVPIASQITNPAARLNVLLLVAPHLAGADPGAAQGLYTACVDQAKALPDPVDHAAQFVTSLARHVSPQQAHEILATLETDLQEPLAERVFDVVYQWVDVPKVRYEDELTLTIFYVFNAVATNVNDPLVQFSEAGGNLSENVAGGRFTPIVSVFSLFRHSFALIQLLERVYNEIKFQHQKEFAYLYYPAADLTNETQRNVLLAAIRRFYARNADQFAGSHTVFNVDFIPALAKPTIIVGWDETTNIAVQTAVNQAFGDTVDLIVDDGLFEGGEVLSLLKEVLPATKFTVLNVVLTYDFLNNLEWFKKFLLAFTR